MIALKGSCLCGAVKFFVSAELEHFYYCHCEQCRKLTGSAFASNVLAKATQVDWLKGEEKIKRFDYPGDRSFTKVFCSECGSSLPFLNKSGSTLFIPAGSLDIAPDLAPELNIFWGDKAAWFRDPASIRSCSGFPDT